MISSNPRLRFCLLLMLLFPVFVFSQYKISGTIKSETGHKLSGVEIAEKSSGEKTYSNNKGEFSLKMEKPEDYTFVFFKEGFSILEKKISASDQNVIIVLEKVINLNEVTIQKQRAQLSALGKMKDIDETAIYAGKKTEVISLDKLTVNKATNNARQIYAQVSGLTINEGSDGGLQLSIGGRGLNPNRTSNFNTRQNGYDISADVLGYPESYYATPTEALSEIQVVRGAASLQYGTQFGGLVNFKIKDPSKKPIEVLTRNTLGSYGLYTNFTSLSGTKGKFSYYTFYNFKTGNGYRPNSDFHSTNFFVNLNYQFTTNTSLHFDYTYFNYLAQQAGGLTDVMFNNDPQQSNRERNWFEINWNLYALRLKHKFSATADFSLQLFGLDASRNTVGYRSNRVSSVDPGGVRDLIVGDFVNWGAEARYLKRYKLNESTNAFLIGAKYYQSRNTNIQGPGTNGSDADFTLADAQYPNYPNQSNYVFPNLNISIFGENIFKVNSNFSITPGFRFEKIKTQADGYYKKINTDLAGNVILNETVYENNIKDRHFVLLGIGMSYKPKSRVEIYGNISQNYRSITFSDIRTANPSQVVDPNISDEKGFTSDLGIRGQINEKITFDASIYGLYYDDKIGEYGTKNPNGSAAVVRYRTNIGTAITYGFETMFDWSINKTFFEYNTDFFWNAFSNLAITDSKYLKSDAPNVEGNKVEFVPLVNLKTGTGIGYKNFLTSLQLTCMTSQYTDANNSKTDPNDNTYGIFGQIPTYYVADFSSSYKWRKWKIEAGITNFTNNSYFTRRATGYPGPGIIPSDGRVVYATLQFVF